MSAEEEHHCQAVTKESIGLNEIQRGKITSKLSFCGQVIFLEALLYAASKKWMCKLELLLVKEQHFFSATMKKLSEKKAVI